MIADSLVPEPLIHCSQRQFNGDTHIVADAGRRSTGTAAEANRNHIRTGTGNATGNGGNIVNGCHFHNHRLFVVCGLFQRAYQLPQILDGVNIVMWCGGDGIGSLRYHPGSGDITYDLGTRQMTADTGLRTLSHLNFDGGTDLQIVFVNTKASGGNLNDGIFSIRIEIFM